MKKIRGREFIDNSYPLTASELDEKEQMAPPFSTPERKCVQVAESPPGQKNTNAFNKVFQTLPYDDTPKKFKRDWSASKENSAAGGVTEEVQSGRQERF